MFFFETVYSIFFSFSVILINQEYVCICWSDLARTFSHKRTRSYWQDWPCSYCVCVCVCVCVEGWWHCRLQGRGCLLRKYYYIWKCPANARKLSTSFQLVWWFFKKSCVVQKFN